MKLRDLADEVSQQRVATVDQVAFCRFCGVRYYISRTVWIQLKGLCTCSWSCCDRAQPGNQKHTNHIQFRDADIHDRTDAHCGTLRDLRDK